MADNFGEGALLRVPHGPRGPLGRTPFTDEARRSLAESLKQARALHASYLGAEHLLLGIVSTGDSKPRGTLHRSLGALGIDYPTTRRQILARLGRASA